MTATIANSVSRVLPAMAGGSNRALRRLDFFALGTKCMVQFAAEDQAQARAFERSAVEWVQAFEAKYSRFRPDSLVSRINQAAGREWVEVDDDMERLLKLCDTLNFLTQGVLDPTALPLIRLWDYKAAHPVVPEAAQIAAAQRLVGWTKVQRAPGRIFLPEPGMAIDFGGFGKEYAVDIVAQIAVNLGIRDVLVDFGHDLRALGHPPGCTCWHVGLEDPKQPGTPAGSIGVSGKGVASSGDYLRCFVVNGRRYGHIIDPRTGWPVANGCTQATVARRDLPACGSSFHDGLRPGHQGGIGIHPEFPGGGGADVHHDCASPNERIFHPCGCKLEPR